MERHSNPDPLQKLSELISQQLQARPNNASPTNIMELKYYIDDGHQDLLTAMRSSLNQDQLLENLLEIYKFVFLNAISDDAEYGFYIKILLVVLRKYPKTCKEAISEILKYAKNQDYSERLINRCFDISQKHESTLYGTSLNIKILHGPPGIRIEKNKNIKLLSDIDEEIILNDVVDSLRISETKIIFTCENTNYYVTQESIEYINDSAMIQCEYCILKEGDCFLYLKTNILVHHVGEEQLILKFKNENDQSQNDQLENLVFLKNGFIGSDISANYKDSDLKPAQFDLIKNNTNWFIKNNYIEIVLYKYLHNAFSQKSKSERYKIDEPQRCFKIESYDFILLKESNTK